MPLAGLDAAVALFKRFWWLIPFVGLTIALLATRATLADVKGERDSARTKLEVSNTSIGTLETKLAYAVRQQQALSAGDAGRIKASREAMAVVDAASKVRQATIDRLLVSAGAMKPEALTPPECEVSSVVKEVWP